MTTIVLPWPDRTLSPNARTHWARKAKAAKSAREAALWIVRAAIKRKPGWSRVSLAMVFCPPDSRRRDRDNLIASMKSATDGIADALGIDDSRFSIRYDIGAVVKGGCVRVTMKDGDAFFNANERAMFAGLGKGTA